MSTHAPASRLAAALVGLTIAACGTIDSTGGATTGGETLEPTGIFAQNGVFVWHPSAFPAGVYKDRVVSNGFRWIAVQIHEGPTPTNVDEIEGWARTWRDAGVTVGGWGYETSDPEGDAALAASLVDRYGLSFYIANAEIEYKYTQDDHGDCPPELHPGPGVCWHPEYYGRSERFVNAFRARKPSLPAALSSYGNADRADLDWFAWREAGFPFLPQAYWNEYEFLDPVTCVDAAVAHGWPKAMVHPTIGIWGGGARGVVTGAEYAARLALTGTRGFSIYLGEVTPEADWVALRSEGGSAPPPPPPSGGCTNQCNPDARECLDGDRDKQCADWDGNGCVEWSRAFSCGTSWPGTTCSMGWCVGTPPSSSCSDECANGARECLDGDHYKECKDWDGDGCTEWSGAWGCSVSWPGTWCREGWCVGS